jgi:hypothetical protein
MAMTTTTQSHKRKFCQKPIVMFGEKNSRECSDASKPRMEIGTLCRKSGLRKKNKTTNMSHFDVTLKNEGSSKKSANPRRRFYITPPFSITKTQPVFLWIMVMMMTMGIMDFSAPSGNFFAAAQESVSVRQLSGDQFWWTGMLHAGHRRQSLAVRIVYSEWGMLLNLQQGSPLPTSTLVLPLTDPLVEIDMPSDWFDGVMPWTQNRLVVTTRGYTFPWHASGHTNARQALWNLRIGSTFWYHYKTARFTGVQFFLDNETRAVTSSGGSGPFSVIGTTFIPTGEEDSEAVTTTLLVTQGANTVWINRTNITLIINPDYEWSTLPNDVYAHLLAAYQDDDGRRNPAMLSINGIPILASWELLDVATLHPPSVPDATAPLILGRKLLQRAAREWTLNGSGHIGVLWDNVRVVEAGGREAMEWVGVGFAVLLCWSMVYWTKTGADTLRYALDPRLPARTDYTIEGRTGSQLLLITILSLFAHFMAWWRITGPGQGDNFDDAITQPLIDFTIFHTVGTGVSLVVLAAAVYLHVSRKKNAAENGHLILAVIHATVSSRGLLAIGILFGGGSMPGFLGLWLAQLLFVLFSGLHMSLVVWSRVHQWQHMMAATFLCGAIPILNLVATHLYLSRPLFFLLNSLHVPLIIEAYALYVTAVVILLVAAFAPLVAKKLLPSP